MKNRDSGSIASLWAWSTSVTLLVAFLGGCAESESSTPRAIRVAVFNVWELSREKLDRVDASGRGRDVQLRSAAEIVQRVRPQILLLNEIDHDQEGTNAALFAERYLNVSQNGLEAIEYPHVFFAAVNTGEPSGLDLDQDGTTDGPEDAWGFGRYPGQYGMALLSQLPIAADRARSFRHFRWADMPNNLMPDGRSSKPAWYSADQAAVLRLSSKSHWDVPVQLGGRDKRALHILAAHPTPPAFDGDEDRNGRRNYDEIRLLADYLSGADYIVDDLGRVGDLSPSASFLVMGDLNADPIRDDGAYGRTAIGQLLDHPRVADPAPVSAGASQDPTAYAGASATRTTPRWGRLDYVLPSSDLEVVDSGVFWPASEDPLARLVEGETRASDHRLVWVTVRAAP